MEAIDKSKCERAEAMGAGRWIERWHGSGGTEGLEGWSILSEDTRELVAYVGRGITPQALAKIVADHNAAIAKARQAVDLNDPTIAECDRPLPTVVGVAE